MKLQNFKVFDSIPQDTWASIQSSISQSERLLKYNTPSIQSFILKKNCVMIKIKRLVFSKWEEAFILITKDMFLHIVKQPDDLTSIFSLHISSKNVNILNLHLDKYYIGL